MTEIIDNLIGEFKPVLNIVVYQHSHYNFYLESHEINKEGAILEGKPLQQDTIKSIVDFFYEAKREKGFSGLIPKNVLKFDTTEGLNMIWYNPAEVRFLSFSEALKIPNGLAWVPAMVYRVSGNSLDVWAINTNNRPTEKTKLFRAPFHNVSDDGSVCLGNAKMQKPKEKTYENEIKYWENLFWLSEFSHLHGSDNPTKTNLNMIWKKLIKAMPKQKITWTELDELKPSKLKTLKQLL